MALLWNSLATREVRLARLSLGHRMRIPAACAWVNYVRCHDDIGWTFDDGDAAALGINGFDHRRFLNAFYTGRFAGSFARGLPFQENPRTGDARISGTLASLAGLEQAVQRQDAGEIELAIRRICLLHAVILSIGGVPLLYLGDEVGMLNDYGYRTDPAKATDSRWVHRPATDWARMAQRHDPASVPGQIYTRLLHLIQVRKQTPAFGAGALELVNPGNDHVLAYVRSHAQAATRARVLTLANFTEMAQPVRANEIRLYGLSYGFTDLVTGRALTLQGDEVMLEPYQVLWLVPTA
jgi:amylosucrase